MSRRHGPCSLAALCLALATASASAQAPQPIRIGMILPLTGGSADFGNSARNGAAMAVAEINAVGGYLGRPLVLVLRDDKADPETGRAMAIDLVAKEMVDFTIGYCNTGVALKSLDVFEANKHLLMVPCSTGTLITRKTPPAQSFVFRMAPVDVMKARFLVREIVDRRKVTKVALFADRTGYGDGGLRDLTAELDKRNLKPVHVARFDLGV